MIYNIINLLGVVLIIIITIIWIHGVVNYNPKKPSCDYDCDHCVFPSYKCDELNKKKNK